VVVAINSGGGFVDSRPYCASAFTKLLVTIGVHMHRHSGRLLNVGHDRLIRRETRRSPEKLWHWLTFGSCNRSGSAASECHWHPAPLRGDAPRTMEGLIRRQLQVLISSGLRRIKEVVELESRPP
jgi:hypothetical protein